MHKKEQGITLVALVVSIVVLLILAGVSITMLTGENGILKQANEAKEKTEQASQEEQKKLAQVEASMNFEEKDYTDKNNQTLTIPEGMVVSPIEGENEIKKGLVTIDKNGNEWVFVEVSKEIMASSNTDIEIQTVLQNYAIDYQKEGYTDTWYEGCGSTEEEYNNNKSKMLQSIKNNGGFWIGRYEVGSDVIRTNASATLTTPMIQVDKYVYNWINISQAQELAKDLNPNNKNISSLMYGIQWNLILKYLEIKNVKTQEKIKTDSSSWGNYSNAKFEIARGKYSTNKGQNYSDVIGIYQKTDSSTVLTTGASQRNQVLNIYDLAGNEQEWTLQKNTDSSLPSAFHGGDYNNSGSFHSAYDRNNYYATYTSSGIGMRPTLY